MENKIVTYAKKNWKSIALVLVLACLILFNVKQYQHSAAVIAENQRVNILYQESLKREAIYNQEVAQYKSQIETKNQLIAVGKLVIDETEKELAVSQNKVKSLSKKILEGKTDNPEDLTAYVKSCDSLAVIAPVLSDQVDTLKKQNKDLVQNLEDKSVMQDSIISVKDKIILDKQGLLTSTLGSYNKAVGELQLAEKKVNKANKAKNFWVKASIVLGAALAGAIAIK